MPKEIPNRRTFPLVTADLLRALEAAFPDKLPRDAGTTLEGLGILIGQQRVIDFLRNKANTHTPTL